MPILLSEGKEDYYTEEFKATIRSCKEIILEQATWVPLTVPSTKFSYKNDFYKLLRQSGISENLIWTVAFINNVVDPTNWTGEGFFDIREDFIEQLIQTNKVRKES